MLQRTSEQTIQGKEAMSKGKFVAYYRVSTAKQGVSGLGLDAQKESVHTYLNGGDWKLAGEIVEVESGKNNNRPALAEALMLCHLQKATLVIAKLDRLARNVNFISNLMEAKVEFVAVDFPQANRLTIHILAAVAEHEAAMISARTKAALQAAKAKGTKLGGDAGNRKKIKTFAALGNRASADVRSAKAVQFANDLMPVIDSIRVAGAASLRQMAAGLNDRGFPTARGCKWNASQVKMVLQQADRR